jgi:hypothetical protein
MQVLFEERNIEWILVCDDPSLSAELKQYLSRRRSFLLQRTILILSKVSYGYSLASAIGVEAACGEFLLFIRSNIWVANCAAIDVALQALRNAEFGVVGFRLSYEETIQHNGDTD